MSGPEPELLWFPAAERVAASRMSQYQRWLADNKNVLTTDYRSLWQWSITDLDGFWSSIWEYFDVLDSAPGTVALAEPQMPGAQWFPERG